MRQEFGAKTGVDRLESSTRHNSSLEAFTFTEGLVKLRDVSPVDKKALVKLESSRSSVPRNRPRRKKRGANMIAIL